MRMLRRLLRLFASLVWTSFSALAAGLGRLVTWPMPGERGLALAARIQALWARGLLRILGLRVELPESEAQAPREHAIVVANHLSYLDILVLGALFPGRFVAKREITTWPFLGAIVRSAGTIFIDPRVKRDVPRVGREMERTLAAGVRVILFAEGRATRGLRVEPLKSSLFESAVRLGLPCRAVALSYSTPGEPWSPASTVCWFGGMGFWSHAWRLAAVREIRARVRWASEPISADDRKVMAGRLHRELSEHFIPLEQVPVEPDHRWKVLFDDM